jgi:hypothetical protein
MEIKLYVVMETLPFKYTTLSITSAGTEVIPIIDAANMLCPKYVKRRLK